MGLARNSCVHQHPGVFGGPRDGGQQGSAAPHQGGEAGKGD